MIPKGCGVRAADVGRIESRPGRIFHAPQSYVLRLHRRRRAGRPGRGPAGPLRRAGKSPAHRRVLGLAGWPRGRVFGVDAGRRGQYVALGDLDRSRRGRRGPPDDLRRKAGFRPEILAGRPQARVSFEPRRRLAGLGHGSGRRRSGQGNIVSDRGQRLQLVARREVVRLRFGRVPRLRRLGVPGEGAQGPRGLEGEGARGRAAALPPLGLLEGRDPHAHLEGPRGGRGGRRPDARGSRRAALRSRRRRGLGRLARRTGPRLRVESGQDRGALDQLGLYGSLRSPAVRARRTSRRRTRPSTGLRAFRPTASGSPTGRRSGQASRRTASA